MIQRGIPADKVDRRIALMTRSFPDALVTGYESLIDDIIAVHPDEFRLDQLDLYPGLTLAVLRQQAASYRREPTSVPGVLVLLERTGVPRFAAELRRHL
ncbi:hypothetical protein AB0C12_22415 [Actinoplanes sp. NPDC048967]|uniref:hypothetical protein n=1 Tax=Actinoplanes sp. NPDC048967 TaxID=3155269 RepID=UPI0033CEC01E